MKRKHPLKIRRMRFESSVAGTFLQLRKNYAACFDEYDCNNFATDKSMQKSAIRLAKADFIISEDASA